MEATGNQLKPEVCQNQPLTKLSPTDHSHVDCFHNSDTYSPVLGRTLGVACNPIPKDRGDTGYNSTEKPGQPLTPLRMSLTVWGFILPSPTQARKCPVTAISLVWPLQLVWPLMCSLYRLQ